MIQASSQKEKNPLLYQCTVRAAERQGHQVVNLGVFPEEDVSYTYVETALLISLLLSSGAADFAVTGCSSGQGMILACNSLPGVLCPPLRMPSCSAESMGATRPLCPWGWGSAGAGS